MRDQNKPRPTCNVEGCESLAHWTGRYNKLETRIYRTKCSAHHEMKSRNRSKYKAHKKDHCENIGKILGFECPTNNLVMVDRSMLTVDHIDGDHQNNDPTNLMTLDNCCSGFKTKKNKDYLSRRARGLGYTGSTLDLVGI